MAEMAERGGILSGSVQWLFSRSALAACRLGITMASLGQMFGYATALRSLTRGRSTLSMEFDHFGAL